MARPKAITPVKQEEYFVNICLHGEPGVGKSVLAASTPKTLLLLNDADESSAAAELGSTAHKWVINTIEDMEQAYEYVRHEGYKEYEWVWIDNLTLLQEQFMDQVMEQLVADKPHRNRWVPDMHEYLVVQNQVGTYIRYFRAIPIHFGWTAHCMRTEDEDGHVLYTPMIQGGQGALSQKLCGYMNVVGHLSAIRNKEGDTERKLTVTKRGKFYAKSRWSGLQGTLTNTDMPAVMKRIQSKFPNLGNPPPVGVRRAAPARVTPATNPKTTITHNRRRVS